MSTRSRSKLKEKVCCPSRRQALAMVGAAPFFADPVRTLMSGILNGLIMKAQAATTGIKPRNYLYVALGGGAPRWYWDNPLMPYSGNASILPCPSVCTRFTPGSASAGLTQYATTPVTLGGTTLNMPSLWACSIPTSSGGSVPMTSLLNNMVMIRGVNLLADGHPDNSIRQIRPSSGAASLDGLVADASSATVPAVTMPGSPGTTAFRSNSGLGQAVITPDNVGRGDNLLGIILSPFDASADALPSTYVSRRAAMDAAVNSMLSVMGQYAASSNPGADSLYSIRSSVVSLIRRGIGDVSSVYTTLYNKYSALITACTASAIPGVTDLPISPSTFPLDASGNILQTSLTNGAPSGNVFVRNPDLRSLIQSTTTIPYLASGFAVAEYLITHGYSSSITMGAGGIQNLLLQNYSPLGSPATVTAQLATGSDSFDAHFSGAATNLISMSFAYRALSACLYELIQQLKAANLFNETVIHIGGDFGRSTGADGSGSGHGWMANSCSILSGAIQKPSVVGNISVSTYVGGGQYVTFGAAASTTPVSGTPQQLLIGHLASSISALLRVTSPIANAPSLFVEDPTQGVIPVIPLAANS